MRVALCLSGYFGTVSVGDYSTVYGGLDHLKDRIYSQCKNVDVNQIFEVLPSGCYCSNSCKRPYNILSIAILLLDVASPGYFLNIPPNNRLYYRNTSQSIIKEPLLGRGCEEVTFQEIYFLIVAILKIVTLFYAESFIMN